MSYKFGLFNVKHSGKKFFSMENVDDVTVADVEELVPVAEPEVGVDVGPDYTTIETTIPTEDLVDDEPASMNADTPSINEIEGTEPDAVEYATPEGGEDNGETQPPAQKDGDMPDPQSLTPYLRAYFMKKDFEQLLVARDIIRKNKGMLKSLHAFLNQNGNLSKAMGYKKNEVLTAEKFNAGLNRLYQFMKTNKLFK